MTVNKKYVAGGEISSYEEIKIDKRDLDYIQSIPHDVFERLHKITEYRLAMELSKRKITIEDFEGAMKYGEYLLRYFRIK